MTIRTLMNKDVVTVHSDENLNTVATLMRDKNIGSVVVVEDKDSKCIPKGIITDRDIVTRVIGEQVDLNEVCVKDVASQPLVCLKEDQGVAEAMHEMTKHAVRRAPIVSAAGKILGIISLDDILMTLADELKCIAGLIKKQVA